jgi:hypothetical protein
MAQVELQAGPHRIVSLMSREAADELALEVGSSPTPRSRRRTSSWASTTSGRRREAARAARRGVLLTAGWPAAAARAAPTTRARRGTITVFAAASLTEAFTQIARDLEADEPGTRWS